MHFTERLFKRFMYEKKKKRKKSINTLKKNGHTKIHFVTSETNVEPSHHV